MPCYGISFYSSCGFQPHLTLHYESQEQKQQLEKKVQELQQKNEQLLLEKAQCREEVEQLKLQVGQQSGLVLGRFVLMLLMANLANIIEEKTLRNN